MERNSAAYGTYDVDQTPFLSKYHDACKRSKGSNLLSWSKVAQVVLLGAIWILFIGWIALLILYPTQFFKSYIKAYVAGVLSSSYFSLTGYSVILYSLPLFLITILGSTSTNYYVSIHTYISQCLEGRFYDDLVYWCRNNSYYGLSSTKPVLANNITGVISSADLGFILVSFAYTVWCFWAFLSYDLASVPDSERWTLGILYAGARAGEIALIFLGFLFLPVARGSVLLRLIDIPFEHAVKYHIWVGHWMMALFTLHGLAFVYYWHTEGTAWAKLTSWGYFAILPGAISLVAGWAIWVTSLPPVRPRAFELFFYTHQLYVVFIIFMALHTGDLILGLAVASLLFFLQDRFLRFCQSRKAVGVLAARVLPCGSIELILDKPSSLRYHALSFIFLNVPKLSWLQWHPFSVSSSPFDGDNHIAVLIKPLGHWTMQLQAEVKALSGNDSIPKGMPVQLCVAVEGPYGHESDYYLGYKKLLLVAGGIGIAPFVAILRDILHRYQHFKSDLPEDILLVWAVKKSKELHLIDLVDPSTICPEYTRRLNIQIRAYVTQELQPDSEWQVERVLPAKCDATTLERKSISDIVATGSNYWFLSYTLMSMIGYGTVIAIFGCYLIQENSLSYSSSPFWVRGGYAALSMVAGVIVFGGIVVGAWGISSWKPNKSVSGISNQGRMSNGYYAHDNKNTSMLQAQNTVYGERPKFKQLFGEISKEWTDKEVGVLVCGPLSLQTSVANECRSSSYCSKGITFHYHSLSFDL